MNTNVTEKTLDIITTDMGGTDLILTMGLETLSITELQELVEGAQNELEDRFTQEGHVELSCAGL